MDPFNIAHNAIANFQHAMLWALIVGIILAFLLGFGMGANDVANAFGTSVGSGVLRLWQAYILATIFETLGAVLVGYNVTDTMRKGVLDLGVYNGSERQLMIGEVAALAGCSAWLMIATLLQLPVSTTHSLVGATLGFSLVLRGTRGIQWRKIVEIVISWFLSPALSGTISMIFYLIVDHSVLRRMNPFKCGLRALPIFYFICIAFNAFTVTYDGSKLLHLDQLPIWLVLTISFGLAGIVALIIQFLLKNKLKVWIINKETAAPAVAFTGANKMKIATYGTADGTVVPVSETDIPPIKQDLGDDFTATEVRNTPGKGRGNCFSVFRKFFAWLLPSRSRKEDGKTLRLFSSIQVFTACFAGFAHGANDVSNAIAPMTALMAIYREMSVWQTGQTPIYVLLYGVVAICIGLWVLGHRVIKTVGQRMSEINSASGFTIEFGAAVTTLLASKAGLPISTTHCLVGSVVAVGAVRSGERVDWKLFRNIAFSWIITLPASGAIAALAVYLMRFLL